MADLLRNFLCMLCLSLSVAGAAKILAFIPMAVPSHHNTVRPIIKGLADKGHHVTVYSNLHEDGANYKQVKIRNCFEVWKNITANKDQNELEKFRYRLSTTKSPFMRDIMIKMMDYQLKDPVFRNLLDSNEQFDLVLAQSSYLQEVFVTFGHRFKAPVVDVIPVGNFIWSYWIQGSPVDTSYMMDVWYPLSDEMNFLERLMNTYNYMVMRIIWWYYHMPQYQQLIDTHLQYPGWEDRPPIMEMIQDISLVLLNTNPFINYPYPLAPHYKEIGGINVLPYTPLPNDLQDFMDKAEDGVIYFSFGSHISASDTLGRLMKEFIAAFEKLKQKVIWKSDGTYSDIPKNVLIQKWCPQQSILGHPNIKMFISQGGLMSMTEAMYYGVPIVGIPLLGDQPKNIRHVVKNEYGVHLDFENLTETSITWAINEILKNPKYAINAKKKSELLRDQPMTPLETAIYWIEYVIRHKGAHHLKPSVRKLYWYQQALVDVYFVMVSSALIAALTIYFLMKMLIKTLGKCLRKEENKIKLKKK